MKKLFLLFSLWPYFLSGQVIIDFENGLPSEAGQFPAERWDVTTDEPLNGSYSLKHIFDNDVSSGDRISFHHDEALLQRPVTWEFTIRYPYKPSASNNWSVFLLSEKPAEFMAPDRENRALVFGVNYVSSDDLLKLYLQQGTTVETLCTTSFNWEEMARDSAWRLRIIYRPEAATLIEICGAGGEFVQIGSMQTPQLILPGMEFSGILYNYTSSKDRLLWFDDLKITADFTRDTVPPALENIRFSSGNSLTFLFNEDIMAAPEVSVVVNENPADSLVTEGRSLQAFFHEEFRNDDSCHYVLRNIPDLKGNVSVISGSFVFFIPARYDMIISEIMADPSPPVYLPEGEYVEIFNRSVHGISLEGWSLGAGSRIFTADSKIVPAGGYHIFCAEKDGWLFPPALSSPVFTSSSVLTNEGQTLVLRNQQGVIIDAVHYISGWYADDFKTEGGWSLERIDMDYLCGSTVNWKASESPDGGTPGQPNSVAGIVSDTRDPFIKHVIFDTAGCFRMVFSEPVILQKEDKDIILVPVPGNGTGAVAWLSGLFGDTLYVEITGKGDPAVVTLGTGFSDCSGNMVISKDTLLFGKPVKPGPSDIIINEVLYAPFAGCPEFIELFNRSGALISLSDLILFIAGDDAAGAPKSAFIAEDHFLFPPGSYLVLSPDPSILQGYYDIPDEGALFKMSGMPSLGNDGATIRLTLRSGEIIDEMHYSPADQYAMISDDQGISLERMSTGPENGLAAPWHSASSLAGFATPGYSNSQLLTEATSVSSFVVENKVFTPDNDGRADVAVFRFHFEREGYVGTFRIFDPTGRIIRTIGVNELLGPEGFFTWDGRNEDGVPCAMGIYLGYLEVYHLSGRKKVFRETVVLARYRN